MSAVRTPLCFVANPNRYASNSATISKQILRTPSGKKKMPPEMLDHILGNFQVLKNAGVELPVPTNRYLRAAMKAKGLI